MKEDLIRSVVINKGSKSRVETYIFAVNQLNHGRCFDFNLISVKDLLKVINTNHQEYFSSVKKKNIKVVTVKVYFKIIFILLLCLLFFRM